MFRLFITRLKLARLTRVKLKTVFLRLVRFFKPTFNNQSPFILFIYCLNPRLWDTPINKLPLKKGRKIKGKKPNLNKEFVESTIAFFELYRSYFISFWLWKAKIVSFSWRSLHNSRCFFVLVVSCFLRKAFASLSYRKISITSMVHSLYNLQGGFILLVYALLLC